MEEVYHIPALLKQTIEGLAIKPDGLYVDVTFGGGGHSRAILQRMGEAAGSPGERSIGGVSRVGKRGRLFSFDQDMDAYENELAKGKGDTAKTEGGVAKGEGDTAKAEGGMVKGEGQMAKGKGDIAKAEGGMVKGEGQMAKGEGEIVLHEDERWQFVHSNFRYLKRWMDYYGVEQVDGVLADLGVSFHHFDCPERGFSFRFSAPLDMRMNVRQKQTAADVVNSYDEESLARVLYLYGELKNARGVAKNICKARLQRSILRTEDLVSASRIPADMSKELARLFQAVRIEVNDEMGALREMLMAAKDVLRPGGRIAILTYHSLEDRLVKNFFRSGNLEGEIEKDFYGNVLSPFKVIEKGLTADADEVARNPRSRSAKLRVAERI